MASSRWSLRNIYLYLVCLITLIMVIVAAVGLVRGIVDLAYPDPYITEQPVPMDGAKPAMTEEEWQMEQDTQARSQRRYAVLDIVGNAAMLLIAGPLYLYHWRKIETEHSEVADVPAATAPPAV
jgi:hypothetical protein